MKQIYLGLILFLALAFFAQVHAADNILYHKNQYTFTQSDANELIKLAEFLGRSNFNDKDKKALIAWSILDFKSAPKQAVIYYKDLKNNLMPKIRAMKDKTKKNNLRVRIFLNYLTLFNKHPEYSKSPNNFLAIIDRYNPPSQEALALNQLLFKQFQMQHQMNQRVFNQRMRLRQKFADAANNSIQDLSNRQAITIPGGTILYETEGRIFAKDQNGREFNVVK